MKKLILLVMGVVSIVSCDKSKEPNPKEESQNSQKISSYFPWVIVITCGVNIPVEGGVLECAGGGPLCRVDWEPEEKTYLFDSECYGTINKSETNRIVIKYDKASLAIETRNTYFLENGRFVLPGKVLIPSSITSLIGLDGGDHLIEEGDYHYEENSKYLTVYF